ncbi:MAG: hypothetical protein ACPKPY_08890 [Nitrososphaeraceae archaeon]
MINSNIRIVSSLFISTFIALSFLLPFHSYASGDYLKDIDLIDFTNDHILVKPADLKNDYFDDYIKEYNNENRNSEIIKYSDIKYDHTESKYVQDFSSIMSDTNSYIISIPIPSFR